MLIAGVALARLYFGAHWLTDVLGALGLGLAWVAALGLAFRRHTRPAPAARGLKGVASLALVVAFTLVSLRFHPADLARYTPPRARLPLTPAAWESLAVAGPPRRIDLRGRPGQPFTLHYAGELPTLIQAVAGWGWQVAATLAPGNALRLLSPSLPLDQLPLIPQVHDGQHEAFALSKAEGPVRRLVLRFWATPSWLEGRTPLWLGTVTAQHRRLILNLLAPPATAPDTVAPLAKVLPDLGALAPRQPTVGGPWLLGGPGPRAAGG
ncbi:MAG: hypothetical protein EOM92_15250 [Gammaproteobacteria bacterium]|nr:hypothetical protein [Gammaproteobacteria bacterium]